MGRHSDAAIEKILSPRRRVASSQIVGRLWADCGQTTASSPPCP